MYRCVTKESEYPNQTRYAEKTEPRVPTTLWSIESNNHKQEVESQCQNQQDGYALVWMHHLEMDKLSVQDNLWKVSIWYKLSSRKIIIKTSGLCPSVSISKANIDERSTTNHTSSNQNESPLKVMVVVWKEYPTSSKERACPNMKKINQSDMSQQKCALTWSCPDVSWYL